MKVLWEKCIDVPGDLEDTLDLLAGWAIDFAREESPIYAMPCLWVSDHLEGEPGDWIVSFRVQQVGP